MKKYIICTLLISLSLIACGRKNVKNPHQKEKTVQVHFQGNHFKKTDWELLGLRGKVKRLEEIFDYYEYAEDGSAKKLDRVAVLPREGTFCVSHRRGYHIFLGSRIRVLTNEVARFHTRA